MSTGLDAEQIEMWEYWGPSEVKRDKTPLQMVREYHETAGIDLDVDITKDVRDLIYLRANLLSEECDEAMDELFNFNDQSLNPANLLKELADLVYVSYGCAATFGLDLDEALKRVHENNMGRMYQPDGSIKRREDGKIMKNPDYPKVNLEDLV